ncbi:MAG: four helix bundle protein [Acidobacteria bacterium]|nr:MAG: four helix bundle protein [Acidobacteriota bacterium]
MNEEVETMNDIERRDLRKRTKLFALRIVKLYASLPRSTEAQVIGKQVVRSGTSVGAHYREAKRARSTAEFISKIEVALQELDETIYWLELLTESGIVPEARLTSLKGEAEELIKMLVSSAKTAKSASKRLSSILVHSSSLPYAPFSRN